MVTPEPRSKDSGASYAVDSVRYTLWARCILINIPWKMTGISAPSCDLRRGVFRACCKKRSGAVRHSRSAQPLGPRSARVTNQIAAERPNGSESWLARQEMAARSENHSSVQLQWPAIPAASSLASLRERIKRRARVVMPWCSSRAGCMIQAPC